MESLSPEFSTVDGDRVSLTVDWTRMIVECQRLKSA